MKKLLILTLAMCLLASASFATYTRVKTMGNNDMVLHDEYNIWMFPSTLYDYPEMFIGEFTNTEAFYNSSPDKDLIYIDGEYPGYDNGGYVSSFGAGNIPHLGPMPFYVTGFTNLGAHFTFNEENPYVVGVYFTNSQAYMPLDFIHPSNFWFLTGDFNPGDLPDPNLNSDLFQVQNQRIDLFYSRMMGENKFGAHVGWVYSGVSEDSANYNPKLSMNVYNIGLGYTAMENKLDLGLDFKMLSWTEQADNGDDITKPDGCMSIMLAGRYFNEMSQKTTLIPHGKVMYEKLGTKYYGGSPVDVTEKDSFTGFKVDLGLGMNYNAAANVMAVTDVGVKFKSQKLKYEPTGGTSDEVKLSDITLPYFKMGLEATVFDWFDLRMGGVNYWLWESLTYPEGDNNLKLKAKYVMTEFYLGGGFHWGNLFLDAYTNPQILNDGLYFINGSDTYPFAYQVSLKYKMF